MEMRIEQRVNWWLRQRKERYYFLICTSLESRIPRVKRINSKVLFLCDPSFCASGLKTRYSDVEGSGPRTRENRVKGIKGVGKLKKFIKRFLSWHRRTSVGDLLALVNDPTYPQENSTGEFVWLNVVDGSVRRSSKLPWNADEYHPSFCLVSLGTFKPAVSECLSLSTSIQSANGPHPRLPSHGSPILFVFS